MKDKLIALIRLTYKESPAPITRKKALLYSFFLGIFGVHRYMMGYKWWWVMFLTMGGLGIWSMIDLWRVYNGTLVMSDGTSLSE